MDVIDEKSNELPPLDEARGLAIGFGGIFGVGVCQLLVEPPL